MSRQAVIPGGTANPQGVQGGGTGGVKDAFRLPAVQRAIQRLRTKNTNLLDLAGGSVLTHDIKEYFIKPLFKRELAKGHPDLNNLHRGGTNSRYGHPMYTWFMNACVSRAVNDWLWRHVVYILPEDELEKLAAHLNTRPADGGYGYLKRRFSQRINHYYVINRLQEIADFGKPSSDMNTLAKIAGVTNDLQDAIAMKSNNISPKVYRAQHPAASFPLNLEVARQRQLGQTVPTGNTSSSSSSSSNQ